MIPPCALSMAMAPERTTAKNERGSPSANRVSPSANAALAPVAASFHPMLLAMTEPERIAGLPIYLVHGALDWMFPVSTGRTANRALSAAGAAVTYREIEDLSHVYPVEENDLIVDWLLRTPAQ